MPIEIAQVGNREKAAIAEALERANSLQGEFVYTRLPRAEEQALTMLAFDRVNASDLLDRMAKFRREVRGFHPFLIALVDAYVDGETYSNLFGSCDSDLGLGVVTSANVSGLIIPERGMAAYYLYYFARYAHCFISPQVQNHDDTRGCIYDTKVDKKTLLMSMRAGAFCDECRRSLSSGESPLSPAQFAALDGLFGECGRILGAKDAQGGSNRPRVFVGSSTEGLPLAQALQASLGQDWAVEIWNESTVFGLGTSTLEALEDAVKQYSFGVFLFTPDDRLVQRGETRPVARDNVIFEMGLFTGKLGRRRAFVVKPTGSSIALPSDLAGITTAGYDTGIANLAVAIESASRKIREAIAQAQESPPRR